MNSTHTNLGPVACHGCGKLTPISTRLGTPIGCAHCGVEHTVTSVLVTSTVGPPPAPAPAPTPEPAPAPHVDPGPHHHYL